MSEIKRIKEESGEARNKALEALFADYDNNSVTVTELPSKGKFYKNFQGVEVSPLTFTDEQRILNSRGDGEDIVSKLLEKTVRGVEIEDLLSMDKMYLLMRLRELSYGDMYEFNITCNSCTTDIKTSLKLSEHLNMNQVEDDLMDPREIVLPKLKAKVLVRFPRSKEEKFLTGGEHTLKNIFRFIVSINGNQDPVFINQAIKRLHLMDIKTIINEVTKGEYGIDPRFYFECPECSHTETMAIPMDVGFFSVS
tara:strand:+ start:842 stop:1597 length:756 start_codon:yes stop_codon:yes gene_type:complete